MVWSEAALWVAKKAALMVLKLADKWVAKMDACWVAIQAVMMVRRMVCFVAAWWVVKKAVY